MLGSTKSGVDSGFLKARQKYSSMGMSIVLIESPIYEIPEKSLASKKS